MKGEKISLQYQSSIPKHIQSLIILLLTSNSFINSYSLSKYLWSCQVLNALYLLIVDHISEQHC